MSKVMSVSFSEDVYNRLVESSEKMGLTKGGFINYSLKQTFNQEDMLEKMPDMLEQLKQISKKLDAKE